MKITSIIFRCLLLVGLAACGNKMFTQADFKGGPYFEDPPEKILFSDKEMFSQALSLQYKGQLKSAIQLWEKFIGEHSRSFEAWNNLGMAYYSNDELDSAIRSFESALEFEGSSARIKQNLRRTLRFRVTLHKENKDLRESIEDLKKIAWLVDMDHKEKVLREIEDLLEDLYSQVEKVDTAKEYKMFLRDYPTGIFADKAKQHLKELEPQMVETAEAEKPEEFLPPLTKSSSHEETKTAPVVEAEEPPPAPLIAETLGMEIQDLAKNAVKEPKMGSITMDEMEHPMMKSEQSAKDAVKEPKMGSITMDEMGEPMMKPEESILGTTMDMVSKDMEAMEKIEESKVRKVKVVTKQSLLNIRSRPSMTGRIIGKLKKGSTVRVLDENPDWYQVLFGISKDGWISKKYSKEVQ